MKLGGGCGSGVLEELKERIGHGYVQNALYTNIKLSKNKIKFEDHRFPITLMHLEIIISKHYKLYL